jgi:hypothetical protein
MAAGDITKAIYASLAIRLEDPSNETFTNADKIDMLNKAQDQLTNFLHDGYFSELETVETSKSVSSGYLAFSSLNSGLGILRGKEGIKAVRFYPGGSTLLAKWATEIDIKDIKKQENSLLACSDSQPGYYPFASKINILATTLTSSTVDVHYLKMPVTMSDTVDPIINSGLFTILINLAESLCWNSDAKLERGNAALTMAMKQIEVLNTRYTMPSGLGTQNRKQA